MDLDCKKLEISGYNPFRFKFLVIKWLCGAVISKTLIGTSFSDEVEQVDTGYCIKINLLAKLLALAAHNCLFKGRYQYRRPG